MIKYNSSGGIMKKFNNKDLEKAIKMTIANLAMEDDFVLKNDFYNTKNVDKPKTLVLREGGNSNVRKNTQRS